MVHVIRVVSVRFRDRPVLWEVSVGVGLGETLTFVDFVVLEEEFLVIACAHGSKVENFRKMWRALYARGKLLTLRLATPHAGADSPTPPPQFYTLEELKAIQRDYGDAKLVDCRRCWWAHGRAQCIVHKSVGCQQECMWKCEHARRWESASSAS